MALAWIQGFRTSHREHLQLTDDDLMNLPLDWIPAKWEKAIFPDGRSTRLLHRRYFELCVFDQVMRELSSGDLYVEGSDRFDDFRVHQVSEEVFERELPHYCDIVRLPTDGKSFIRTLWDSLSNRAIERMRVVLGEQVGSGRSSRIGNVRWYSR